MTVHTHAVVAADGFIERLTDAAGHIPDGHTLVQLAEALTGWPAGEAGRTLRCTPQGQVFWHDARTLSEIKSARVASMRQAREDAINGTFAWEGSTFDADQVSQTRMLGAFIESQAPGFTTLNWRLADNSWRTLDADDVASVWAALRNHMQAQFATFAAREAAIASASTIGAVEAIAWA